MGEPEDEQYVGDCRDRKAAEAGPGNLQGRGGDKGREEETMARRDEGSAAEPGQKDAERSPRGADDRRQPVGGTEPGLDPYGDWEEHRRVLRPGDLDGAQRLQPVGEQGAALERSRGVERGALREVPARMPWCVREGDPRHQGGAQDRREEQALDARRGRRKGGDRLASAAPGRNEQHGGYEESRR